MCVCVCVCVCVCTYPPCTRWALGGSRGLDGRQLPNPLSLGPSVVGLKDLGGIPLGSPLAVTVGVTVDAFQHGCGDLRAVLVEVAVVRKNVGVAAVVHVRGVSEEVGHA